MRSAFGERMMYGEKPVSDEAVNRGEAAVRLIRAVRELNAEHDYGIRVIALHTEAERRAMFVRQADEGVTLRSTGTGSPYLDYAVYKMGLNSATRGNNQISQLPVNLQNNFVRIGGAVTHT